MTAAISHDHVAKRAPSASNSFLGGEDLIVFRTGQADAEIVACLAKRANESPGADAGNGVPTGTRGRGERSALVFGLVQQLLIKDVEAARRVVGAKVLRATRRIAAEPAPLLRMTMKVGDRTGILYRVGRDETALAVHHQACRSADTARRVWMRARNRRA